MKSNYKIEIQVVRVSADKTALDGLKYDPIGDPMCAAGFCFDGQKRAFALAGTLTRIAQEIQSLNDPVIQKRIAQAIKRGKQ